MLCFQGVFSCDRFVNLVGSEKTREVFMKLRLLMLQRALEEEEVSQVQQRLDLGQEGQATETREASWEWMLG